MNIYRNNPQPINRILLLGKNGQIGWELQRTLAPLGEVIALGRQDLNLTNINQVREMVGRIKPVLVVNAAAYTAVDQAESDQEQAMFINGIVPGVLAEECKRIGAGLIHYSTDFVFDGRKQLPYGEEDKPNPINIYGKTKLAGEEAIQSVGGLYFILRTSWVYGNRGKNFLLTMLKMAREREEISVVDDQIGTPNWCRMIAEATAQIWGKVKHCRKELGHSEKLDCGIYHLTSAGETTWFGFAEKIFALYQDPCRLLKTLLPIKSDEYQVEACRPHYSVLSTEKLVRSFGLYLDHWQTDLELACSSEKGCIVN